MYICMYICILIRYSKPNGKTELARYGLHNTQAKEMQFPPPNPFTPGLPTCSMQEWYRRRT